MSRIQFGKNHQCRFHSCLFSLLLFLLLSARAVDSADFRPTGAPSVIPPNQADLVVVSMEIDPGGFVKYRVRNRGKNPTGKDFIVSVFIDGALKGQLLHQALAGQTDSALHGSSARIPLCKMFSVSVVADSGNWVVEADESNNQTHAKYTGFCPDVTASIHQDIMDYGTRYRSKITVENKGNGPMQEVNIATIAVPNTHFGGGPPPTPQQCATDPTQPCEMDSRKIGPLLPGQKDSFHVGKKRIRTTTMFVQVTITCTLFPPDQCAEANVQNNLVQRVLGPH